MGWKTAGSDNEAIAPYLRDPSITEVMINGAGPVWIERNGQIQPTNTILDTATIELLIERAVAPLGRRIDRSSPMVDARLTDGSRLNAVVPPVAVDGPYVTIRRFSIRPIALEEFAPPSVVTTLRWAVATRCNLVVSGGAGAGKTTLLNALASSIADDERVVTIEDAAELNLGINHAVRLEARPSDNDGVLAVTIRQLVRNALRMRPDRIIVGEVRGAETLDMLQAMNTGHEGSLSTCHANSPEDAISRLETMVLFDGGTVPLAAVREQITAAIDMVVHIARRPGGGRYITSVTEMRRDKSRQSGARPHLAQIANEQRLLRLPEVAPRSPDAPKPDLQWLN
ncbi:MAG: CpaF family protein [Acidimicrobiia bacterium]|nr:CpaF family protein [Acidimicrobiia bacterium]MYC57614.1 CpaF family protein [Acidimicrobiia bacterium]MYI31255.1 CpaF family protein [Acidimicrobiia bacterium]